MLTFDQQPLCSVWSPWQLSSLRPRLQQPLVKIVAYQFQSAMSVVKGKARHLSALLLYLSVIWVTLLVHQGVASGLIHQTPVSRFGEQHEPMSGMHHNMAMGDGGGVTAHGMAGVVWNPVATMQLHGTSPKVWGA
ncbi:uncharacterized protein LOC119733303 [Patiria miniata]|uniref:Uncharacterized protein n=1 Tax=Patiria miniata TaxID=46514 RepID=A0A914AHH3_PATMI|nr:uncharacterized protein LOC119733303 [Patiria miniata]